MIDIHSHLLPGVDDGPRDWTDSLELCRAVVDDGVRVSVATPHLIDGVYDNVADRVGRLVAELNERLGDAGIELAVMAGAEVDLASRHVSERDEALPHLGGGNAVLLEMPVAVVPPAMAEILFGLSASGLVAVLAHPERNELVQERPSLVAEWAVAGAHCQIDAESLLGLWGRRAQRAAEELIETGLARVLASDAHSVAKRPPRLAKALARAIVLRGDEAEALVGAFPNALLEGRELAPTAALHLAGKRRQTWFGRLLATGKALT